MNWAIGIRADVGGDERVVACERVGQEEAGGQRVRFVGVDEVEENDREAEDEREQPGMADALALEFGEVAACCSSFGAAGGFLWFLQGLVSACPAYPG